jgi:hypothetical protein
LDATTREKAVREMARMVDEQRRGVWFEPLPRRSGHFDEFANECLLAIVSREAGTELV